MTALFFKVVCDSLLVIITFSKHNFKLNPLILSLAYLLLDLIFSKDKTSEELKVGYKCFSSFGMKLLILPLKNMYQ